ncbi:MAG: NADP-dependent oxidoreductase [Steroidobacteraceae bacterium]
MKAVRFNQYGGIDVLQITDVPIPEPAQGEVLVKVKAASINPGEAKIRAGLLHARWPATFPSGEGSDFAGIVAKLGGAAPGLAVNDEVIGFTNRRASHAEYVVVGAANLTRKPANVSWEVAGSLPIAGSTAYAAVRAVSLKPGDTVAVSGAAGGVGSIAVQLARRAGASVSGIAGPGNHDWLMAHGIRPVAYGEGLSDRLRAARLDALIDTHGGGYVKLAVDLGLAPERINTIIDFPAVQQYHVKAEGSQTALNVAVLAELARLVAASELEVPIAAIFPLADVRSAFALLEKGHTRGKIVLLP